MPQNVLIRSNRKSRGFAEVRVSQFLPQYLSEMLTASIFVWKAQTKAFHRHRQRCTIRFPEKTRGFFHFSPRLRFSLCVSPVTSQIQNLTTEPHEPGQ